jgi:hypothetical protein
MQQENALLFVINNNMLTDLDMKGKMQIHFKLSAHFRVCALPTSQKVLTKITKWWLMPTNIKISFNAWKQSNLVIWNPVNTVLKTRAYKRKYSLDDIIIDRHDGTQNFNENSSTKANYILWRLKLFRWRCLQPKT